ncbi:hypothetical protein AVEN_269252-1 [Araneus ventricosus]|uniref:Uncharacterized protein n=1 Tax=Araneus ventricosus TaxID=182803 RepID=A0A4Y2UFZ1_ARAVE|nr:hypothetical protein AVEN_269252-1 [Araneus ventricosus]
MTGDGFSFLKTKFPHLSEAKIKEGIFVGPEIRQLFNDSTFMKHLNRKEKRAWLAFKNMCMNFLGSKKSDDYVAHAEELLSAHKAVRFPSREHRSHEKESAVPFHIRGKQQDNCIWSSLTRRTQKKWLHTEGRHNAEESITVRENISGTLWCHP